MSLFTALRKLIQIELTKGEDVVFSFPQNEKGKVMVKKRIVRKVVKKNIIVKPLIAGTDYFDLDISKLKGGEKMKGTQAVNECRELMDRVLNLLREEQKNAGATLRGRELAIAVTHMEEGCMRMIRSEHADKPYSPLLKLKEDKTTEPKAPEAPAQPAQTQQETAPAAPAEPQTPANQPAQEQQPAQPATGENQAPADQPANTPAEQQPTA